MESTDEVQRRSGIVFDLDVEDPKERIQAFIDGYKPNDDDHPSTFDLSLMRDHIRVLTAVKSSDTTSTSTYSMLVAPEFCNRTGSAHGGAVSLIIDMCTTMAQAPIARPGFWEFGGFSRTLSVTFLRPVLKGMEILVVCEVMQVGKALATIHAKVYRKADMVLLCTGEHNKAFADLKARNRRL